MRRLAYLLFFLVLVEEGRSTYAEHMFAPFRWVHAWLLDPVANARPIDALFAALLLVALLRGRSRGPTVRPLRRTLYGAVAVTLFALAYGLATGGSSRFAGWQVYLPLATILATFTLATVLRTAEDFIGLGKVMVAAGVCHAVMCLLFHFMYIRPGLVVPLPEYEGTHDDTVLWTVSVAFVLVQALQSPTTRNRVVAAFVIPLLLAAIQFNRRRLAWVSLAGCLITLHFLLPPSAARRRINRVLAVVGPVLLIYVAIGWGRTEGVFRPLRAFQTVSTDEDASTKARNVENLGLIATANKGWVLGTGWGHGYVEVSNKYQIYMFELWDYVPHNSVLGLFAYTGYLGFVGYWMTFPMAAFLHARLARQGSRPEERLAGTLGLMQLVACADQWYGDMGSFSAVTAYTLASSLAAALRLPIGAGVWAGPRLRRPVAPAGAA